MQTITFNGVKLNKNMMAGFVSSKDIVEQFNSSWIPDYQRGRIMSKAKINALVTIFKEKKEIDGVKLAFYGETVTTNGVTKLKGEFNVIDGQQRLYAVKDSKVLDMNIPVELYLNCTKQKEIALFRQYNKAGTALTLGDLAKSCTGSYGQVIGRVLKRAMFPIKVFVNSSKSGINLSVFTRILAATHSKVIGKATTWKKANAATVVKFLEAEHDEKSVNKTVRFIGHVFNDFVSRFGEYDSMTIAYRRPFFLAWYFLMLNNFYKDGQLVFGTNSTKLKMLSSQALKSARIKELISGGSDETISEIYNYFVNFINTGKHKESARIGQLTMPGAQMRSTKQSSVTANH